MYNYHPKIKSETCPSIPLFGDCCGTPGCRGTGPASPGLGICGIGEFVPGLLNAEDDGANLMGVPTVGVWLRGMLVVRASEDSAGANPCVGDESDIVTSGVEVSGGVPAANGLRVTDRPRSISA